MSRKCDVKDCELDMPIACLCELHLRDYAIRRQHKNVQREKIASAALQGLIAASRAPYDPEKYAIDAVNFADALIEKLNAKAREEP